MAGITNNNTPPTANTNRDQTELIQQKGARAFAFYQNNLELADPLQIQINRPQRFSSSSGRAALQYARTTQISLTLQQQLAVLDPAQFKITTNPMVYPPTRRGAALAATGNFTIVNGNTYIFIGSGSFNLTGGAAVVDVLVVAGGGGGGGSWVGGGGGGGGLVYATNVNLQPSNNTITVGNGGAGGTWKLQGIVGQNSSFLSYIGFGGGGGGADQGAQNGLNGGCGGGPSWAGTVVGLGSQGGNGSRPIGGIPIGGGGGGMGASATTQIGGAGISNSITGSSVFYSGGGGGGSDGTAAVGGIGGGGRGCDALLQPTSINNGTANTGGGGGGGPGGVPSGNGGNGGSGIVIIKVISL